MPVKRRTNKRRSRGRWTDDPQAWEYVFQSGHDFFGEVQAITGLIEAHRVTMGPERKAAEAAWREAARDAWHSLGPSFLAAYQGDKDPWALTQFGRPWETDPASPRPLYRRSRT